MQYQAQTNGTNTIYDLNKKSETGMFRFFIFVFLKREENEENPRFYLIINVSVRGNLSLALTSVIGLPKGIWAVKIQEGSTPARALMSLSTIPI